MSLDIEKVRFFDARIMATRPRVAIQQGSLAYSSSPFSALSATTSQLSFQIITPSQQTYLDRRLPVSASVFIQFVVTTTETAGEPVILLGRDIGLCPFPLHSLFSSVQINLGDATVSANLAQSREILLRLLDSHKGRAHKTAASYLDKYKSYNDADGAANSSISSFEKAVFDEPNGCSPDVFFCNPSDGQDLVGTGTYTYNTVVYNYVRGVPVISAGGAAPPGNAYPIFMRIASTELLQVSPFQFREDENDSSGIFGLQNIAVTINVQTPSVARLIRQCSAHGRPLSTQPSFWVPSTQTSCWSNPQINATFLTPPLSISLPPRSVVPYQEIQCYQFPYLVQPGASAAAVTQTLSLPIIPDLIVFTVTPTTLLTTDAPHFLPIKNISVAWSTYSGLLSSLNQENLYRIAAQNGLNQSYSEWRGRARTADGLVQTVGGVLPLIPSVDIPLAEGEAPGIVSNSTVQATLTVDNSFSAVAVPCTVTVTCINSGFLISERGQTRIVRGMITQSDVLSAPIAGTGEDLRRLVGRGIQDHLGTAFSKSKDYLSAVAKSIKKELPKALSQATDMLAHRIM